MSAINLIKQGESFDFSFDRDGETISGWTCQIDVMQFAGGTVTISRAITATGDVWSGFLTKTETAALSNGLQFLVATLEKSATDEQEQQKVRFQVASDWTGGTVSTPAVPSTEDTLVVNSIPVATNGLIFWDGWTVPKAMTITKLSIFALDAPTGADLNITLLKNGVVQTQVGVLTDGSGTELTTFGTPLALAASDRLGLKYTQVGSTTPGNGIIATITYLPS